MSTMTRRVGARILAAVVACVAGTAWAVPPAALDLAPADAPGVILVRNIGQFEAKAGALVEMMPGMLDQFAQARAGIAKYLKAPGVNAAGSMAMIMPVESGEGTPGAGKDEVLFLVPVSDFGALVKGLGGEAADKVAKLTAEGQTLYARDVGGGFALVGPDAGVVEKREIKPGQAAGAMQRMGGAARIADSADVVMVMGHDMVAKGAAEQGKKLRLLRAMTAQEAGVEDEKGKEGAKAEGGVVDEVTTMVLGLTFREAGVAIDTGTAFKAGTDMAAMCAQTTDSGRLLSKLPSQGFMIAGAFDLSAPGVRAMIDKTIGANGQAQGAMGGMVARLLSADGFSFAVGQSAGGIMGGTLFSNTIAYVSHKDPAGALGAIRENAKSLNGTKNGGASMTTSVQTDQPLKDAPDQKVDLITTTMEFDPNDAMGGQMEMAMGMLMGGNNITQMIAATDGGLLMTMTKNSRLMRSALASVKAGSGMGSEAGLQAVRAALPEKRSMELYLGVRPILEAVRDSMMLEEGDMPLPEAVSPIGIAATTEQGSLVMTCYMPSDAMKAITSAIGAARKGGLGGAAPAPAQGGKRLD